MNSKYIYAKLIKQRYKQSVGIADKQPEKTALWEAKVAGLGLDLETYLKLALDINDGLSKHYGWKYPYWAAVTSDKTFDKISVMVKRSDSPISTDPHEYEMELLFAQEYVDWLQGNCEKPSRQGAKPSKQTVINVLKYLCKQLGLSATHIDNYAELAVAMERNNGHR